VVGVRPNQSVLWRAAGLTARRGSFVLDELGPAPAMVFHSRVMTDSEATELLAGVLYLSG